MKKIARMAVSSPVTAFAVVFGIVSLSVGLATVTGHNIAFGAMTLALAYVNAKEDLGEFDNN